jgi:hypothetical protein
MSLLSILTLKLRKKIPQSRRTPYIPIFFYRKLYTLYQGTEGVSFSLSFALHLVYFTSNIFTLLLFYVFIFNSNREPCA